MGRCLGPRSRAMLAAIVSEPREWTVGTLAADHGVSRSTAQCVCAALQRRGLIVAAARDERPQGGRGNVAILWGPTASGIAEVVTP